MGRKLKPIKHGTPQGYRQEIWRGYRTCASCRRAWRNYCKPNMRRWRKAHPDRTNHDGTGDANRKRNARLAGLTPPPTPDEVREAILRDSQDPSV